jgi:hypothetical protein
MSRWATYFLIRTTRQNFYFLGGHSRRIGWTGYAVRLERRMMLEWFSSENLEGRDHLGELCVNERIILNWIANEWGVRV